MLTDAAETMRLACIAQLYDDWHGWYVLQKFNEGQWIDVRRLTRDEAVEMKYIGKNKALLIVLPKDEKARDEAVKMKRLGEDEELLIVLNDHVSNPVR